MIAIILSRYKTTFLEKIIFLLFLSVLLLRQHVLLILHSEAEY